MEYLSFHSDAMFGGQRFSTPGSELYQEVNTPPSPEMGRICNGCDDFIADRYLLLVGQDAWHASCLRCNVCDVILEGENSCYVREDRVYCRLHYRSEFSPQCAACGDPVEPDAWVRWVQDRVYHLACFVCVECGCQLSTGEQFVLQGTSPLCKRHVVVNKKSSDLDTVAMEPEKKRRKRIRSSFTKEQQDMLQQHFERDTNPDCHDMETLAEMTGHSRRVIQVWFQNARARNKKQKPGARNVVAARNQHQEPRTWGSGSDSPDSNSMSD